MTARAKKEAAADPEQSARFIEAARELGCDESPGAFEAAVKKVARHKPMEEKAAGRNSLPSDVGGSLEDSDT